MHDSGRSARMKPLSMPASALMLIDFGGGPISLDRAARRAAQSGIGRPLPVRRDLDDRGRGRDGGVVGIALEPDDPRAR